MKKSLLFTRRLKASLMILSVLFFSSNYYSQCNNTAAFGTATAPTTIGLPTTITTCAFYGEYSTVNGVAAASQYTSTINGGGFVTVRQGTPGGPVVASGASPLTWSSTTAGTYYMHWNSNAACGTGTGCLAVTITYVGLAFPCTDPAVAGTTVSNPAAACPTQNFTLSLNGASLGSGLTYQWQSSPDGTTYTDVAGATNSSLSTTQTATTFYQCIISCSAGTPATSTPVQVDMNPFFNCYCASNATSTADEEILNVSIGTLNNSSTCSTTGGPGSTLSQYSNYTTDSTVLIPNLARGVDYPMSVQIGTCGGNFSNNTKAWIDFNQNGSFSDPGEQVLGTTVAAVGPNTVTATVNIPLTAALGQTRMRVVNVETFSPAGVNPCGTYAWGETEDYFVSIAPVPTCPQPNQLQVLTAGTTSADLTWNSNGTETEWEIVYGAPGFNPDVAGTSQLTTIDPTVGPTTITPLTPNTFYQVYVRAICTPGDSSFFAGPISFNTFGLGIYMESDVACGDGFIDISTTGTEMILGDDDETAITFDFPVYYQGTLVTDGTIGNNGAIILGNIAAQVSPFNAAIGAATANGLYPFWDDLEATGGGVWKQTIGTAPNRKHIVQWKKDLFGALGNPVQFQVQIDEATMQIYYVYDDAVTGLTTNNLGASATIGIAGPSQDLQLSFNNATFLTNNECARFYYTDCPKPTNMTFTGITQEEAVVNWSAGLSGETEWTLEYGPTGFTPGSPQGTVLTGLVATTQLLPNLTQITTYDVYIYANCANGDTSNALVRAFTTLPNCAAPTGIASTADIDSLFVTWNYTPAISTLENFNLQYGMTGFAPYTGTIVEGTFSNNADTIADAALMAGVSYQIYVQSVCTNGDTSGYAGPFTITMPLTNDTVCYAEMLNVDGTIYNFIGNGATVDNFSVPNEASIAPPLTGLQTTTGWGNNSITRSTWFTFVAPATGQVRIDGTNNPFDGQMAVYEVEDCDDFGTFTFLAGNDNAIGGSSLAPNFTVCGLTPGNTYYLMHDPFSTFTSVFTYSIKITPISLEAGNFEPLSNICYGDTLDLFQTINGYENDGFWIPTNGNIGLVQDSLFASIGLAYTTFDFEYRVVDGCAYDSIVSQVKIFPPSTAGNDGGITVCRNEPLNLLAGLSGIADLGGTWYDPANVPIANSQIFASDFPGNYNYDYIVGNGVCPDDTALVIVNVLATCNYNPASVEEIELDQMSVYPNPTDGLVYISNSNSTSTFSYDVLDMNGRTIATQANAVVGSATTEINLNNVETGVYMIRVYNENANKTFRVVVR
jgi:hypothetical protein